MATSIEPTEPQQLGTVATTAETGTERGVTTTNPNNPEQETEGTPTASGMVFSQEPYLKIGLVCVDHKRLPYTATFKAIPTITLEQIQQIATDLETLMNAKVVGIERKEVYFLSAGGKAAPTEAEYADRDTRANLLFVNALAYNEVEQFNYPAPLLAFCAGTDDNGSRVINSAAPEVQSLINALQGVIVGEDGVPGATVDTTANVITLNGYVYASGGIDKQPLARRGKRK